MRILFLTLLFSCSSFAVELKSDNPLAGIISEGAKEETLTAKQIKQINKSLQIQSMIIESVLKIEIQDGRFINSAQAKEPYVTIENKKLFIDNLFKAMGPVGGCRFPYLYPRKAS